MAKALTGRVVKSISLLGSTQAFNMLCSVVRMKMLSLWIGPVGVGLMGVLTQTLEMLVNLTQLNIRTSAVRDVAMMPPGWRGETIGIVRRVGRTLGLLGLLILFVFAPVFCEFSFGSQEYVWSFRILSIALLLHALQGSELIVLQAEGRFRQIAVSGAYASVVGLIIALILFKTLGINGIALVLVSYSLVTWLFTARYTRSFRSEASALSLKDCFHRSRKFIEMGFYLVISGLVGSAVSLGMLAVVQRSMGDVELGLFQAGNTMLIRYVGVFFSAITFEFYPRLSAAAGRRRYSELIMTHQARVCSLMFFPCAVVAMLLAPWLIRLLYSGEFLPMMPYFVFGMVGMMMRPASMVLSYSFIVSAKIWPYLFTEILSSLVGFGLNVWGYLAGGWVGLGLSTALWYLFDLLIIYVTCRFTDTPAYPARTLWLALLLSTVLLALSFALV